MSRKTAIAFFGITLLMVVAFSKGLSCYSSRQFGNSQAEHFAQMLRDSGSTLSIGESRGFTAQLGRADALVYATPYTEEERLEKVLAAKEAKAIYQIVGDNDDTSPALFWLRKGKIIVKSNRLDFGYSLVGAPFVWRGLNAVTVTIKKVQDAKGDIDMLFVTP